MTLDSYDESNPQYDPNAETRYAPEDNDDEVAARIAEHERAIFDNPDPFYGP